MHLKWGKHDLRVIWISLVLAIVLGCQQDEARPAASAAVGAAATPATVNGATPASFSPSTVTAARPNLRISTEQQLFQTAVPPRDLRDLTVRLRPDVDEAPAVVNQSAPDYAIGDQIQFYVHNVGATSNIEVMAELIHKTDVAYGWVEVGQSYNRDAIIQAMNRFSTQSYPAEVAFFGSEWNPGVDNDPRLHILHTTGMGGGVAGYYSSADQYSRLANPYSNEKEMFYINLQELNTTGDYRYYETVLAHEFQHMIHWHNDSNEWTWVNEGLSEFAQEVTGFGTDTVFVSAFVNKPDTQLNSWNLSSTSNSDHYGASYLHIKYLNQRFGPDFLKALVAQPENSIEGVQTTLQESGHPLQFDALFADWIIANYANQPDALGENGLYGYRDLVFPAPISEQIYDRYPADPYRSLVDNYAADYVRFDGAGDVLVTFSGQTTTRLANIPEKDGNFAWWSNRSDSSDSTLTRQFDLSALSTDAQVKMEVAMWWDIEVNYDYGYVLASRDNRKWDLLAALRMTKDNPTGNSFGPGYTGKSDAAQWVTEQFDLSPYAGESIWLRFEYITDDGINGAGWFIDDVRIPALDYAADFEAGADGWDANGWLLTDNHLAQGWLLQVMEFESDTLANIRRIAVSPDGSAQFDLQGLDNGKRAVLAVSALAPVTTEKAAYELYVE